MPKFIEVEDALINADQMAYARKREDHVMVGMIEPVGTILLLYPVNCSLEELWADLVVPIRDGGEAGDE